MFLTVFSHWIHKMKYKAASKIIIHGWFVYWFLVEKYAAGQSHGKSDFGWVAFSHFPLLNAYYKEVQKSLDLKRFCWLSGATL